MTKLHTWDRIWDLFHGIERRLSEELRNSCDLGISEFRTLHQLVERPEREVRMLELSEILQLSQSSTTRLVERLERRGLVLRGNCPSDGRGKYCILTKTGEALILKAMPEFEEARSRVLAEIFRSPEAREVADEFRALALG